jgi:hypothetical protein
MNWVQINERLLELERKEMTEDEVKEWNRLLDSKIAGILKRKKKDEKNNGETKKEERREEEVQCNNAVSLHGHLVEEEALL